MARIPEVERRVLLQSGLATLVASIAGAWTAAAQDAVKTDPGAYRVVFENASLRVLEFLSRPRTWVCGVGKHSHPAHLTIALSDAKVRVSLPDGRKIDAVNKLGDVFWSEAETHTVENIGAATMRALIVELKHATKA
jgi:hypothetical protein